MLKPFDSDRNNRQVLKSDPPYQDRGDGSEEFFLYKTRQMAKYSI